MFIRYIFFRPDPWRGYANQLYGISSAMAIALLLDRALIIDDEDFARLFYSPFIDWKATTPPNLHNVTLHEYKDCDGVTNLSNLLR